MLALVRVSFIVLVSWSYLGCGGRSVLETATDTATEPPALDAGIKAPRAPDLAHADTIVDPCRPNPCRNGGVCSAEGAAFRCSCVGHYTGNTCEVPANACESNPCREGYRCVALGEDFECECAEGDCDPWLTLIAAPDFCRDLYTHAASAADLSADGRVLVGNCGNHRAFRWSSDEGLEDLGLPDGAWEAVAMAVSADGSVVVGWLRYTDRAAPFIWSREDGLQRLPGFAAEPGGATAVNADGSVVVGWIGDGRVFRWKKGEGTLTLPLPPDVPDTARMSASATDAAGDVIAGWVGQGAATVPYLWRYEDGARVIEAFDPSEEVIAKALSADARVVVGDVRLASFRWSAETGRELFTMLNGAVRSHARATNQDGSVVVGDNLYEWSYGLPDSKLSRAFIWDTARGLRDLNEAAAGADLALAGWTLTHAVAVSADGRTVAGSGRDPTEKLGVWVAHVP
jgi:uncharacterized membrane protein